MGNLENLTTIATNNLSQDIADFLRIARGFVVASIPLFLGCAAGHYVADLSGYYPLPAELFGTFAGLYCSIRKYDSKKNTL